MGVIENIVALKLLELEDRIGRLETLETIGSGAAGGGDLTLIETKTITAPGGEFLQFLNIPQTYRNLFYTGFLLGNGANMFIIMNGSAAANDLSNLHNSLCTGGGGVTTVGNLRNGMCASQSGVGAPADINSAMWGWVPNYVGGNSQHGGSHAWSGAFTRDDLIQHMLRNGRGGGNWDTAFPVTQLDFGHDGPAGNTWFPPTSMSLYGMSG